MNPPSTEPQNSNGKQGTNFLQVTWPLCLVLNQKSGFPNIWPLIAKEPGGFHSGHRNTMVIKCGYSMVQEYMVIQEYIGITMFFRQIISDTRVVPPDVL